MAGRTRGLGYATPWWVVLSATTMSSRAYVEVAPPVLELLLLHVVEGVGTALHAHRHAGIA